MNPVRNLIEKDNKILTGSNRLNILWTPLEILL